MKTILVADDEFDLAGTLQAILEGEGYGTSICSNGREVMDSLKVNKPDLLLMDVMMPLMGGYEVLRIMKQTEGLDGIPVVLMSAAPVRLKPTEFKWDAYLRKPFSLDAVLQTVSGLIGKP